MTRVCHCGSPITSPNPRVKYCPACADASNRAAKAAWAERMREEGHDENDGTFWRIVAAPDMQNWGRDSQFRRSEIAGMLRPDEATGERGLLDGTILERVGNPEDMRIVSGGKLRVYVGAIKTNVILTAA